MHITAHLATVRELLSEIDSRLHIADRDGKVPPGTAAKLRDLVKQADTHTARASVGVKSAFAGFEAEAVKELAKLRDQVLGAPVPPGNPMLRVG